MNALRANVSCVLVDGRQAMLIEGPPGSGKSTLAMELIDRGAVLVGDDGVALERRGNSLWASPPPNIAGLLEVRNVGLVELPAGEGPVALLVRLDPAAPRFIDAAGSQTILGCAIPTVALDPAMPALALRAQWALRKYALVI